MSVQVTSASEASSHSGVETPLRSSGIARRVPPRRTVSIAAWHTCQFPVPSSPTAPFTGFTVRPHASYKSDRNKADQDGTKKKGTDQAKHRNTSHSYDLEFRKSFKKEKRRGKNTRSLVLRNSRDEGHQSRTTKKLGHKHSGVALGLSTLDPLQTRA